MNSANRKRIATAGLAAVALLGASACSKDSATEASSSSSTSSAAAPTAMTAPESTSATADPAANLVGTGCAGYAEKVPNGPGSVAGMAQDPVPVAASNNPMLTTLTSALSGKLNPKVNLVDTLSKGEYTVFAPTDDAFAKLPPATIEQLKTDSDLLTKILTYHVVSNQLSPAKVVGEQKSLEGGNVAVTGAGPDLKFNDAGLVCGGVQTLNATVYMVDTVLMPPASQ
jgi:uncharacterized surface protein with fasciclin (FAS1) repeats